MGLKLNKEIYPMQRMQMQYLSKCVAVALVASLVMLATGCDSPEKSARDSIAAAKGAIEAAQAQHEAACKVNATEQACVTINRAVAGENAAVTALETYCGFTLSPAAPPPDTKCVPVQAALPALRSAIANLNQFTTEIRGTIQ